MKETKTGDVAGRSSGRSLFLGDPGAIFFCGKLETDTKKEKRSKKERKRRPVETDAADGNPQRTRIPTATCKTLLGFAHFPQARRRRSLTTEHFSTAAIHLRKADFLSEGWGVPQNSSSSRRLPLCRPTNRMIVLGRRVKIGTLAWCLQL